MTDKLKPCPFCGGPAEYWGDDGKAGCASNMDSGCPFDEVMYAHEWNARPIEDALRAERDALVDMLADEFGWEDRSYAHAVMHADHAVKNLRAEVAALKAECAEAWRVHSEVVAELKAKLAKYTGPLTDDQIVAIEKATAHLPRFGNRSDWWDMRDAAIRAAREGEG